MAFLGLTAGEAALGAAGIQAGGSLLGGMFGASGAAATNAQQMQMSQQLMNEQENYNTNMFNRQVDLANTTYQRGVADMKAAGLNPILALSMGGDPTPNALGIVPQMPSLNNPGAFMASGVSSAAQAGETAGRVNSMMAQASKDSSQSDLNQAGVHRTNAETGLTMATTEKAKADTAVSAKQLDALQSTINSNNANANASNASAALDNARTVIAGHDANTARSRAEQAGYDAEYRKGELDQFKAVGKGPGSDVLGGIARTTRSIGEAFDRSVGQPIGHIVDQFRAGHGQSPNIPNSAKSVQPGAYVPF